MQWHEVESALSATYGSPRHGNPRNPTDCLFYLMLSRKTPIGTAGRVFERLRTHATPWDTLPDLPEEELLALLYGSGLEAVRATHLRQVAMLLNERFGRVSLEDLREWPDEASLSYLCTLPGIGMKTALCILLYGFNRQVFPADAHCIRVLQRMGAIPAGLAHRPAQRQLAELVPSELGYSLHVNLIAHGQQVCPAGRPKCAICAVRSYCAHGRANEPRLAAESPERYSADIPSVPTSSTT